jgi:hypothetical protein
MTEITTTDPRPTGDQPRPPVSIVGPMSGLDQAWRMSQALAQSALLPAALRGKPNDVLVTILYGQEVGLSPMQALQAIYVVNGRPSMSGQLWLAKVRQAGHVVKLDVTDKEATCTITRHDDGTSHTETFTWADAERAALTSKDVWKAWPKRMLGWRAVSNCATIACPEVALGWDLTEAVVDTSERPTLAQVAAERDKPVAPAVEVHEADVVPGSGGDGPTEEEIAEQVAALAAEHEAEYGGQVDTETGELFGGPS